MNFISKEVVDIWEEGNVCHILGKDEKDVVVDAVLIATGRCPYKENFSSLSSFPSSPSSLSSPSPIYIPDHVNISKDTFDSLPLSSTIHVLGASLSAFDVVNALYSPSSSCQFVRDPETGKLKFIPGDNDRKLFSFSFLFSYISLLITHHLIFSEWFSALVQVDSRKLVQEEPQL